MNPPRQLFDLAGREPDLRFSPYCWRARFALAHKGLSVETLPWRLHEGARLAASGQNKVPVLVDGTRVVHDSWAIACYLDETYPDAPSLFGGVSAAATTRFINAWADQFLHGLITPLIVLRVHDALDARDQPYFRASREQRFKSTLEAYSADLPANLVKFQQALQPVRTVLAVQPWLAGHAPAYADYVLAGTLQWSRLFLGAQLLEASDPVRAWFDRVLDLFDGLGRRTRLASTAHP